MRNSYKRHKDEKDKFDLSVGQEPPDMMGEDYLPYLPDSPKDLSKARGWNRLSHQHSEILWDWKGYIPRGYLTMLVGMSGIGKSLVLLRLCGCYTNGWKYPDGSLYKGEPGMVLWGEGEAAQSLNLVRAIEMGIDTSKMLSMFDDPFIDFNMENRKHNLELARLANFKAVKLICIDSYSGVHAGDENNSEMNQNIKFLATLARDIQKPIILTHHLRKKSQFEKNIITLDRVRGSSSIVQTARVVIAIDQPDPTSPKKRLNVIKSNLSAFPKPIGFIITGKGIEFSPAPTELLTVSELDRAKDFLKKTLDNGPVDADLIYKLAKDEELAERTLDNAKSVLKIKSDRVGGSDGKWQWKLPDPSDQPAPPNIPF